MAMTPQQARMKAMQLRTIRPELQNMAVEDLIAQVMASEGAPGAGANGLADLFPPKTLTAASPAPMQAARLAAPKPTASIVPGADVDAFRRAQQVRDFTVQPATSDERATANAKRQALVDEVRAAPVARPPEVAAAAPEAAPVAAAEAAPKAQYRSRFRPQLEQKQAELEQLKASIPAGAETPPSLASDLRALSGVVSRLQGMVAAEEGAVVDADRAALLERQTARLAREEELVEQARKRAPGDALIKFGTTLAGARPGEKFASALARGIQAGSESYTGARDAREGALRGIEEKRDAYTLQKIDALQSARDKAIELANAGVQLTKDEYALAGMKNTDIVALGTQQAAIDEAVARASEAKTKAKYAPEVFEAEIDAQRALAEDRRRPPASGGSGGSGGDGGKPLSPTQAFNRGNAARVRLEKLEKQIIDSDDKGDVVATEQLLNQYRTTRDAFNRNAEAAGLAPITVRGFPVKLKKYEAYVKKNKRHPSGRTTEQYGAYEAANKYVPQ